MENPPYKDQGKPLDEATGLDGEWVVYHHVFLFRTPSNTHIAEIPVSAGLKCPGFHVDGIASVCGCTPDDVLNANRAGLLKVHWQEIAPTVRGAERTIQYVFTMPNGSTAVADLQVAKIRGHA